MLRIVMSSVALVVLAGCQATRFSRAKMWAARGDTALATDPGRALANYQQANSSRDRADVPDLQAKQHEAAYQWLHREFQARSAGGGTWGDSLALVDQLRRTAEDLHVRDRLEPELAPLEHRALRAGYEEIKATLLAKSLGPWEGAVRFAELARAVGPGAIELRAEAEAEATRRQEALWQRLQAGSRHPLIHARLLAAAKAPGLPPATVPAPAPLALRVGWTVEATGCDLLEAAFASLSRAPAGHRGAMRLVVHCEAKPRVEENTRTWTEWVDKEVSRSTSYEETCTDQPGGSGVCLRRGLSDQCVEWAGGGKKCTRKPVTRIRTERVPVNKMSLERIETVTAKARGTLVVEVDGASRILPIDVSTTVSGTSTERAIQTLTTNQLASIVKKAAAEPEQAFFDRHLASLDPLLAAADDAAAEEVLVLAIAAGATRDDLPAALVRLAQRDGLPLDEWLAVVVEQRSPFATSASRWLTAKTQLPALSSPNPDEEGHRVEATEKRKGEEALGVRRVERSERDFKVGFVAAPTHWYTYGGNGSLGLNAGMYVAGGGGFDELPPFFYFYKAGLTLESDLGDGVSFGINGLVRLGAGLRLARFWLAPFAAGGASSRAEVIPWGAELGLGLRLALHVGKRGTLELLGERVSRPLTEGTPPNVVAQRLHYELRYVQHDDDGEMGLGLGCAFHQRSGTDVVLPLVDLSGRLCDLNGFFAF